MEEQYCKVVIIDDEYIMRQGMKHMLDWQKEGFRIVGEASNGQEGLELIEKTRPHIVLADIVMPVLDGIEFSEILKKRFPEMQLIILSSYDKFEYVKTTLLNGASDYILKPTLNPEILLNTLQKVVKKIPGIEIKKQEQGTVESQMERYLSGYQEKLEESFFAEYFPHTLYRVFGVERYRTPDIINSKVSEVCESVRSFFQEKKEYVFIHVPIDDELLCCVLNYRLKEEKNVMADLITCMDKLHKMYGNVFSVVGPSFSNMQEIREKFQKEIKSHIGRAFYFPNKAVLVLERCGQEEKEKKFAFQEYSYLLAQREMKEALERLEDYEKHLVSVQVDAYRLKNLIKNLLYTFLMEAEKYDIDAEMLRRDYFRCLDKAINVEEFEYEFQRILTELKCLCEEKIVMEDHKVIQIKKYIQEHYTENLELAEIADRFNFNYNYLSSYFSRHAKEGFRGYLNKLRIEKACELLKEREQSISQISAAVGYSDHSYFCRVFKKITGNTPREYQTLHYKEK